MVATWKYSTSAWLTPAKPPPDADDTALHVTLRQRIALALPAGGDSAPPPQLSVSVAGCSNLSIYDPGHLLYVVMGAARPNSGR